MLRYLGEDEHVRKVGDRLEPLFSFAEAIYNLWAQQGWERNTQPMPEECIQLRLSHEHAGPPALPFRG